MPWSRRALSVLLRFVVFVLACGPAATPSARPTASLPFTAGATPYGVPAITLAIACRPPAPPTTAVDEGPFFKAGSPLRTSLVESGMTGIHLWLSGFVASRSCHPIANVLLDFWQADASGNYDNAGFRLRGHLPSDAQGRYQLETIIPGEYPGRTQHIHVKVQAPGRAILTTQLYFPDSPRNASDSLFRPELIVRVERTADGFAGRFDFVVDVP